MKTRKTIQIASAWINEKLDQKNKNEIGMRVCRCSSRAT